MLRAAEVEAARISGSFEFRLTNKIRDGRLQVDQGVIAGCAGGTYSNIMEAAHILQGADCGNDVFNLSV